MNTDTSSLRNSRTWWIVLAWLSMITSGTSAVNLLRLATGIRVDTSLTILAHGVMTVAVGSAVIGHLVRARPATRLVPAALVTATFVSGFFAARLLAPIAFAAHIMLAAYAAVAPAATAPGGLSGDLPIGGRGERSWQAVVAGGGVVLLILQIALGALLRQQLVGYGWHLLVAALAALSILVPAVAVSQDADAPTVVKQVARLAIGSLLVQLSLGIVVLFMNLTGSTNVYASLLTTLAHLVAGTITLLTAAKLTSNLRAWEAVETINRAR